MGSGRLWGFGVILRSASVAPARRHDTPRTHPKRGDDTLAEGDARAPRRFGTLIQGSRLSPARFPATNGAPVARPKTATRQEPVLFLPRRAAGCGTSKRGIRDGARSRRRRRPPLPRHRPALRAARPTAPRSSSPQSQSRHRHGPFPGQPCVVATQVARPRSASTAGRVRSTIVRVLLL